MLQGWQVKCLADGFRLGRTKAETARRARVQRKTVYRAWKRLDGENGQAGKVVTRGRITIRATTVAEFIEQIRQEERARIKAAILKVLA